MSRIEQKQPLPFAFYDDINKQNRFQSQCENYVYDENLISVGCRFLPFQIRHNRIAGAFDMATLRITLINIDTDVETPVESFIDASDLEVVEDADGNSYISYFGKKDVLDGDDNCVLEACDYYLKVTDTNGLTGIHWSEVFRVTDVDEEDEGFILWNQADKLKHDGGVDDKLKYN